MDILIWFGTGLSLLGLVGLVWSILRVTAARRKTSDDDELRATIQTVLPYNLGALFVSVMGLLLIIIGIFFG